MLRWPWRIRREPAIRLRLLLPSAAVAQVTSDGVIVEDIPARRLALFLVDEG